MSAGVLAGDIMVPFFGVILCVTPVVTRPTIQFGVRVPAEHAGAAVIRDQRRAYYWRTAAIGVCCTVAALLLGRHGQWWVSRVILLLEIAADLGCMTIARKNIAAAKEAGAWFAGLRQTVVADTSWRSDPPRFPVAWLIPALAVMAATVVTGALRDRENAVAYAAGQLYVTALWTGLLLLVYHSRPDLEAADAASSAGRYRRFLSAFARAMLTLVALVNLTLLLAALNAWRVYRLSGIGDALPALPFAVGLLVLAAVVLRTGQAGFRLRRPGANTPAGQDKAAGTDRDDDRFWKAGLIYVNRDDPALVVGARFGVGWTLNLGNRTSWLVIAAVVAVPAGLAALRVATGL
jgi:uncharacterized membrane protein